MRQYWMTMAINTAPQVVRNIINEVILESYNLMQYVDR